MGTTFEISLLKRLARLEKIILRDKAPRKRVSKYVPKIKHNGKLTKEEINQRIDRKYQKRNAV